MGFGGSPNSKIAQRFSNAMMREFAKRFAAFVEANMDRIPPKLAHLIEYRRKNLSGGNRYQWLPGATAFFTDDCKFAIISAFLCAHELRGFPHSQAHVSVRVLPVGISVSH